MLQVRLQFSDGTSSDAAAADMLCRWGRGVRVNQEHDAAGKS
jgi:hypothetical protein